MAQSSSSRNRTRSSQAQRKAPAARKGSAARNGSPARKASSARGPSSSARKSSSSGSNANGAGHLSPARTALAGAGTLAGLVGGVVLGGRLARKPKRVLGVKVPGTGTGVDGLAKQIGKAGRQFGELAGEVRAARQKAEQVGKVIS